MKNAVPPLETEPIPARPNEQDTRNNVKWARAMTANDANADLRKRAWKLIKKCWPIPDVGQRHLISIEGKNAYAFSEMADAQSR